MSTLLTAVAGVGVQGASWMTPLAMTGHAVGTAVSAFSQLQAAKDMEAEGESAQQVAEQRARQAEVEGREKTARMRDDNRRTIAATRARMSGRGIAMDGSSLTFLSQQARMLELKVSDEARRVQIDAANERHGGALSKWSAKQKASGTRLRGFGTLLEGVSAHAKLGKDLGAYEPKKKVYKAY